MTNRGDRFYWGVMCSGLWLLLLAAVNHASQTPGPVAVALVGLGVATSGAFFVLWSRGRP